jgi:disulfide bond formation protein DsbB
MNTVKTMSVLFALLTLVADVAVIGFGLIAFLARGDGPGVVLRDRTWDRVADVALPLAVIVGLICTLGSLYFSEVAHFIPCRLCWYQRIAMYPMPLLLGIAAWKRDRSIRRYVIPLAVVGGLISIYHYQLEWFPGQSSPACTLDAPCTVRWVFEFGFISLPFMALSGFALIAALTWIAGQRPLPDR